MRSGCGTDGSDVGGMAWAEEPSENGEELEDERVVDVVVGV